MWCVFIRLDLNIKCKKRIYNLSNNNFDMIWKVCLHLALFYSLFDLNTNHVRLCLCIYYFVVSLIYSLKATDLVERVCSFISHTLSSTHTHIHAYAYMIYQFTHGNIQPWMSVRHATFTIVCIVCKIHTCISTFIYIYRMIETRYKQRGANLRYT